MWSISIYSGDSPFELNPIQDDPVLTKAHITDTPAAFVADPFMVQHDGVWYMFMEVLNPETGCGEVGLATSADALAWTYRQIVLKEPFHLSYPYVFNWQSDYYMIPETINAGAMRLYRADEFPYRWSCIARLVAGSFADPSIFRAGDLWWIFTCPTPYQHNSLNLYFASTLTGPWTAHRLNPIIKNDMRRARPAGRVIKVNNRFIRFAQDCVPQYGSSVRAFEILELTPDSYREVEIDRSPILKATGNGWNAAGMHHIDAHQQADGKWLACVDGTR